MVGAVARLRSLFEVQAGHGRNTSMEGLRGFAVALVFFAHYHSCLSPWMAGVVGSGAAFSDAFRIMCAVGVDLFFMLSGYFIYAATLSPRFAYGSFMKRRVERIYPPFLTVLALYLILSYVFPSESKLPPGAADAALYVLQNMLLLAGLLPIEPMITVTWTLSYDLFFYFVLPIMMVTLGVRAQSRRRRLVIFAIIGVLLISLPPVGVGHAQSVFFVMGVALYELRDRARALQAKGWSRYTGPLSVVFALIALPSSYFVYQGILDAGGHSTTAFYLRSLWTALIITPVVMVMLTHGGRVADAFSWRPIRWLGNMSYSYYLLHGLVLKAFALVGLTLFGASASPLLFWTMLPVAFVATLVASAVLFACVENPFSQRVPFPWQGWLAARTRTVQARPASPSIDGPA